MLKLFNRIGYGFSNKTYDVAVIGGGPGGNFQPIQVMQLPSRLPNSDLIPSALRKEALWEEHVLMWAVFLQKHSSTFLINITNLTTTSRLSESTQVEFHWIGRKPNKTKTVSLLPSPKVLRVFSERTKLLISKVLDLQLIPKQCKFEMMQ